MLTALYIVKSRYNYHAAEHKSFLAPILHTITVLKETPQNYVVEGEEATGYHTRVSKTNLRFAESPADAWDIYINRIKQAILSMKHQITDDNQALAYAKEQRRLVHE